MFRWTKWAELWTCALMEKKLKVSNPVSRTLLCSHPRLLKHAWKVLIPCVTSINTSESTRSSSSIYSSVRKLSRLPSYFRYCDLCFWPSGNWLHQHDYAHSKYLLLQYLAQQSISQVASLCTVLIQFAGWKLRSNRSFIMIELGIRRMLRVH